MDLQARRRAVRTHHDPAIGPLLLVPGLMSSLSDTLDEELRRAKANVREIVVEMENLVRRLEALLFEGRAAVKHAESKGVTLREMVVSQEEHALPPYDLLRTIEMQHRAWTEQLASKLQLLRDALDPASLPSSVSLPEPEEWRSAGLRDNARLRAAQQVIVRQDATD